MNIGDKFAKLTILEIFTKNAGVSMLVKCACGREVEIQRCAWNKQSSCGAEACKPRWRKDEFRKKFPSEYIAWKGMRSRCRNPNAPKYHIYGGRGITVCDRWNDFSTFISDMGPKPTDKHSIDRRNTNGNYEPANCRWATAKTQSRNQRNSLNIEINGAVVNLQTYCEENGLVFSMVYQRIHRRGWSAERAINEPRRY